ncbi:hypothetical protein BH10PLA2_BH10PLA2_12780 [soil metagenome]
MRFFGFWQLLSITGGIRENSLEFVPMKNNDADSEMLSCACP